MKPILHYTGRRHKERGILKEPSTWQKQLFTNRGFQMKGRDPSAICLPNLPVLPSSFPVSCAQDNCATHAFLFLFQKICGYLPSILPILLIKSVNIIKIFQLHHYRFIRIVMFQLIHRIRYLYPYECEKYVCKRPIW